MAVVDRNCHRIRVYDSLVGTAAVAHDTGVVWGRIARLLGLGAHEKQPNSYDCGVSVIISAFLEVAATDTTLAARLMSKPDWVLWRRLVAWWVEARLACHTSWDVEGGGQEVQEEEEPDADGDVQDSGSNTTFATSSSTPEASSATVWLQGDSEAAINTVVTAQLHLWRTHESQLVPRMDLDGYTGDYSGISLGSRPSSDEARDLGPDKAQELQAITNIERQRVATQRRNLFDSAIILQQVLQALVSRIDQLCPAMLLQIPGATYGKIKSLRNLLAQAEQDFPGDLQLFTLLRERVAVERLLGMEIQGKAARIQRLRNMKLDPVIARVRD